MSSVVAGAPFFFHNNDAIAHTIVVTNQGNLPLTTVRPGEDSGFLEAKQPGIYHLGFQDCDDPQSGSPSPCATLTVTVN